MLSDSFNAFSSFLSQNSTVSGYGVHVLKELKCTHMIPWLDLGVRILWFHSHYKRDKVVSA